MVPLRRGVSDDIKINEIEVVINGWCGWLVCVPSLPRNEVIVYVTII